jgi:hypothetical protein
MMAPTGFEALNGLGGIEGDGRQQFPPSAAQFDSIMICAGPEAAPNSDKKSNVYNVLI